MVPNPPRTFDIVAVPGDASAKARHSALPGVGGPAEGGVDGEEAQHAADRRMLRLVRQVAVDHVHDAAEQRDPQRLPLGLVRGARPTSRRGTSALVARRSGRWPGPGPRPRRPPRPYRARPRSRASRPGARAGARGPSTRRAGAGRRVRCWPTGPRARRWDTTPSSRSSKTSLGTGNWIDPASSKR